GIELLRHGYKVRALDILSPQVHAPGQQRPSYLSREIELIVGDLREPAVVERALDHVDAVFHFVALVGVGQSMYRIAEYTSTNCVGTAVLLQAMTSGHPVERLVVASSMSVYGESLCRNSRGDIRAPEERSMEQLKMGDWELRDSSGDVLTPVPTPE